MPRPAAGDPSRKCKDCKAAGRPLTRPAPFEGPRCASDWRVEKARRKSTNHDAMVGKTYGLAPGAYQKLKALQQDRCAICQWGRGKSKALAVDHDHDTGRVRGLLCGRCNSLMGMVDRDAKGFVDRLAEYVTNPPVNRLDPEDFITEVVPDGDAKRVL